MAAHPFSKATVGHWLHTLLWETARRQRWGAEPQNTFYVCADEGVLARRNEREEAFRFNKERKMSYGRRINKKEKWRGVTRGSWIVRTRTGRQKKRRSMAGG